MNAMGSFCRWHKGSTGQQQDFLKVNMKALLREVRLHSCWINTEHKALKYWGIIWEESQYKGEVLHLLHKKGSEHQSLPVV